MSTVLESLNAALHRAMQTDDSVILLGEDILDPYGGAFKVTRGLSTAFPERVWSTPISEAGLVGVAAGLALRGLRPVVEIMFGDFVTLAADQIVNHIAKFRWMYNDQVRVPLVIRAPMGGRRGYGPTHSQTLEKLFLGLPGLKVLAPCDLQVADWQAGGLLLEAIFDEEPVLFIENKLLYLSKLQKPADLPDFEVKPLNPAGSPPLFHLEIKGAPTPQLTLAAYGYMAGLAREAALQLAYEHEIFSEIVIPTQLSPFDGTILPLTESVARSGRLLTIEEGTYSLGWGAEVLARLVENLGPRLRVAWRLAAAETPVPASGVLEEVSLPGVAEIVAAARKMV
ncbi:MAG TPA: alpha-ketoacid dehydrogenase subunit beta [Chloroflexi bacterium]|nr:alpha-ketoacid dehydrogenase subunit beta [Chloroflexota bacterium]